MVKGDVRLVGVERGERRGLEGESGGRQLAVLFSSNCAEFEFVYGVKLNFPLQLFRSEI